MLASGISQPYQYKGNHFRAKVERFASEKLLLRLVALLFEHDVLFE